MEKRIYITLFLILTVNVFLKFYGIGSGSIWLDEAYSANEVKYSVSEIIARSANSDNPPLYYLLLHAWTNTFGFSETGIRSFSAVCNIMAACILFLFCYRRFNYETGLFAAILFTVSNQNLYYAQEVRTYAWVVFLTVLSMGYFFGLMKSKRNASQLTVVGLTIANILLVYSHYLSICIPILQAAVTFFYRKQDPRLFKHSFFSMIIVIVAFLPWIRFPIANRPVMGTFWLYKPNFDSVKSVFIELANNKIVLVWYVVIVACTYYLAYRKKQHRTGLIDASLLSFIFLPIIIFYIVSFRVPVFLLRYLLFISIPCYIYVAYRISTGFENKKLKYVLVSSIVLLSFYRFELHPVKQDDWKGAVAYTNLIRLNNEPVILSQFYIENPFAYYFDRNLFLSADSSRAKELVKRGIYPVGTMSVEDLQMFPVQNPVIGIFSHEENNENTTSRNLEKLMKVKSVKEFGNVKVVQFFPVN